LIFTQEKPMPLSLAEFVERWKAVTLTERAAAQSHFIDLCEVLGQPHPAAADQTGESFTFEKAVSKLHGGKGFADVWKRSFFAWEYKGKHHDLAAAYHQLADYRDDLENPPLLVVCDMDIFEVHAIFTGAQTRVYKFTLDDLLTSASTPNCALPPLEVLRAVFTSPEQLRPEIASKRVTEQAASEFAKLALSLRQRGVEPEAAAHFLMRLLFCLFADSIGLLPDHLFRQLIELNRATPAKFTNRLRQLFAAMSTSGNNFGVYDIHWFNGGLFADDSIFDLTSADMGTLRAAADLDWSAVEPAIFGTLFERSLDPGKRSQLGAHYTSKEDILLIVEPVVMAPLERRWQEVRSEALELAAKAQTAKGGAYNKLRAQLQEKLFAWVEELSKVRILDPACGSGNFLYVALRRMLDLWKEAYVFAAAHGLPTFLPFQVTPAQLYGLETNVYAHELASVVVWIGYLQWLNDNGIGWPTEPILRKLDNIQHRDAILAHDADGKPTEPDWPEADFIIGNPPFLGDKRMRAELGDKYVDELRALYEGRVPGGADLVTYWFERARAQIAASKARRAGLLATQGIRGGANRKVLERILERGGIFMAWSDREWILDGANVHVSIICFDNGEASWKVLNDVAVPTINSDLSSNSADLTTAKRLPENAAVSFIGSQKGGKFDIGPMDATRFLAAVGNPNRRPNSDVIKHWLNATNLMGRNHGMWIIDFGVHMTESAAALYQEPFEYVREHIRPGRIALTERDSSNENWWLHQRPRPEMRAALEGKQRYIVTPRHSKHRIFEWVAIGVVPDSALVVFARDDAYFFGALHSRAHEVWTRATGTQVREAESGFRYTPLVCFDPFPFPWPPGHEPKESPLVEAIAEAARELVEKRDAWLNPPDASAEELKRRTLTNLYNARPSWLAEAHRKLDAAVFAAYGWPVALTDAELLERLLALNHERAAASQG
jgi:type II restriction/modification system DNA methylase subunit YeeA